MEGLETSAHPESERRPDELERWKAKKSSTDSLYVATRESLVKASHMQSILKFIDSYPQPVSEEIRSLISADTLEAVAGSMRIKWMPVTVDVEMTEAIYVVLDPEQFKNFWMRYGLSTLGSPLLKQALEAALRLFGLSVDRLITWAPRAFDAYYQNCGRLSVGEHDSSFCNLIYSGVPQVLIRSRPFIHGCAHSFAAVFPLTRTQGQVAVRDYLPARGSVTFRYSW